MREMTINHVDDTYVCQNELISRFPVNRCLKNLCENDSLLYNKYCSLNGLETVKEYNENTEYKTGDVVWFRSKTNDLYLMQRIVNPEESDSDSIQTAIDRTYEYIGGVPNFENYGWKDLNSKVNVDKYGIKDRLNRQVSNSISQHQNDSDVHPLGIMKNDISQVKQKLMLRDMSNIDSYRSSGFFPFQTFKIKNDNVILDGYYRIWDCGLIEMDILYQIGYVQYDEESGMDVLTCNNMTFSFFDNADNQRYFNSSEDSYIFNIENQQEQNYSQIDNTIQKNRNNYVNVFFGNIRFPDMYFTQNGQKRRITMSDKEYMIFSSDIMSQDRNMQNNSINIGSNSMTYGNRTQSGFTAIYITYPDSEHYGSEYLKKNYNVLNGGLVSNSFNCHIVGRWSYL